MTAGNKPTMTPRWVLITSVAVALSTCAPLAWRSVITPPDQHFVGNWEYVHDQTTYLMWAAQVARGQILVRDLHTSEPHPPLLPPLPWLLVGLAARAVPLLWAYHGLRVLSGVAYLLLVWGVVQEYFGQSSGVPGQPNTAPQPARAGAADEVPPGAQTTIPYARRAMVVAFLCIAVGSGLRVVTDLINHVAGQRLVSTADWMPELWGFHSLAVMPHFALALALMAALVRVLLAYYRRPTGRLLVAAPLLMALLTWVHPFDVAVWAPLLALHLLACGFWRRRWLWVDLTALVGAAPPALLFLWQTRSNPVFAAWAAQNVLPSPPVLSYVGGFGAVLVLAVAGLLVLWRAGGRTCADALVLLWLAVTAVMVNAGAVISFERRCIEGAHIPLSLLAGMGMTCWLLPWLRERWRLSQRRAWRLGLTALLVCLLPGNLKLLVDGMVAPQAVIPTAWVRGYQWLADNSSPDECVLTAPRVGMHLAWMALRPVYAGHEQQTIDFERKATQVEEFFRSSTPPARRMEILRQSGCTWVMACEEQRLATDDLPGLQRRYATDTVSIYRQATPSPR